MDILQYINKMNRLYGNDSTPVRFNTQKYLHGGTVGMKPGGLVEPGVMHYATLTEAEKLANIETWEKNTGLKFSDQNISQRSKIRTGTITGLGKGSSTEIVLPTESEKQLIKDWEKNTGKKYKTQTASNQWKIRTGAVTGAGKSAGFDASINAIRNAFVADPDATVQELAEAIYGSDFKKADLKGKKKIINDISNDVPKFMEALSGVRKVKDFKMPNTETMLDIMDNIENNKKGFKFADQTLRNYKFRIRDVALGFEETMSLKEIDALKKLKKGMGLSLDETGTLSATFDKAPGYTSGSQLIDDNLNVIKSKLIDKDFNNVLKAMMSDDPDKLYKWKDKQIKRDELIKLYNKNVAKFKKKYKIDAPTIEIGVNPKKAVSNYGLFSKAEQANMQDIFKNRNFSIGLGKETKPLKTLSQNIPATKAPGTLWSKVKSVGGTTVRGLERVAGPLGTELLYLLTGTKPDPTKSEDLLLPAFWNQIMTKYNWQDKSTDPLKRRILNLAKRGLIPTAAMPAISKISQVGLAYTVPTDLRARPMMETIKKAQKANVPLEDYVTREGGAIEFTPELYNLLGIDDDK